MLVRVCEKKLERSARTMRRARKRRRGGDTKTGRISFHRGEELVRMLYVWLLEGIERGMGDLLLVQ